MKRNGGPKWQICGLLLCLRSPASLRETERSAGAAGSTNTSRTATAAELVRVAALPLPFAQCTSSDCKLGADMYGNALSEAVNVKITQSLAPDPENDGSRRKLGSCTSSQC